MVKKALILILFIGSLNSLFAQVDSSKVVTIRDIHIIGNKITKERIIFREMTPVVGDSYQLKALSDTLKFDKIRIYNTNLFNSVKLTIQEIDASQVDLLVQVEERWYIYPMPVFKLADRNFNDWWVNRDRDFQRVNFGLRYTQWNFRGRAERLRVTAQTGFEDRYILEYRIPYIDKKQQHGITPEIFYFTSKNLGFETQDHLRNFIMAEEQMRNSLGISAIHTYRKRYYDYHFTGAGFYTTHIADTIAILNPNYLGDGRTRQQYMTATYGYQNDRRDNVNYPNKGHNVVFSVSKNGLGIFDDGVDYWSASMKASKFWNLGKGFSHGSSLWGYWSSDPARAFINYWGLGFQPQVNVRGYELDLIEGRSYLMTKNSLKKFLWKRTANLQKVMPLKPFQKFPIALYGKFFFDGAYVWSFENHENNERLTEKFIYGIGTGLDILTTHDVLLRLEYSINEEKERQFFINFMTEF